MSQAGLRGNLALPVEGGSPAEGKHMSSASAAASGAPHQASTFPILAAASIGNALEWYDILVYGYFAVTISHLFFPNANPTTALLLTFGTFGVSYLVRPLGALVLGAYSDRKGRRAAMLLSIVIMVIGTALMAVMPTYSMIGILAPIAVLIARLLQGFAVAGEFGSATAFLVEHSRERKGFFAAFQWFGQGLAAMLASLFGVDPVRPVDAGAVEQLGLARAVLLRPPDRADRLLHSSARRRDAGVRGPGSGTHRSANSSAITGTGC